MGYGSAGEGERVHVHVAPSPFVTSLGRSARRGGDNGHCRAPRVGVAATRRRWAITLFIKGWRKENKVMGRLLIQFVEFEQIFLILLPRGLERSGNGQNVHFQVLKLNLLRNPY